MTPAPGDRFARTEAGKAEIRAHAHALARPARNLLMVIDPSCSGQDWVDRVHGSRVDDLRQLCETGLIAPSAVLAGANERPRVSLEDAVRGWAYDPLYSLLTQQARERFGLIKGYRLVLRIEACANLAELQAVALEFAGLLRKQHGEDTAARFRRQLGAQE